MLSASSGPASDADPAELSMVYRIPDVRPVAGCDPDARPAGPGEPAICPYDIHQLTLFCRHESYIYLPSLLSGLLGVFRTPCVVEDVGVGSAEASGA